MNWTYNGREYQSQEMRAFETGQDFVPRVYLAEDGECFVESRRRGDEGAVPRVRRMGRCEALSMAERFSITPLKEALVDVKRREAEHLVLGTSEDGTLTDESIRRLVEKHQANFAGKEC